ncbi:MULTISPECIES: Holliday junction branch migration protein RuvA [unclassified Polynucleobacter]|jgi:Holliday junction DNA helicase RuvA|uniref:Holliday junction branch migration protein RuvA n=1 Tax=unclassified Polynucleobacter TaxID=2640945 RepID=UPI00092C8C77|nr:MULTISPECIES: Holliday junction branch migration protein RuvA [unclassified Polynucleobacter]MBU3562312.1 Holliday junction branch migration protein RuvA [Polynucleobacter sp. Tro8-14-1]MBU3627747.1 Holliday junction branch migration protein RuvA [Polynucleobacter sp. AP-Reno-20A-A9]MBU3641591.1 Holliday junction branch migration protein RuvA [Polynucleobacter sp. Fuers-14]MEA9567833.1 Holliday junction branch migration protein RuvA [Polynucleobacter sp. AP-Nickl1-40-C4]MEA9603162.1 Hollida
MIGRIQGTLVSVHPPRLLVDCQGIGYEVDVPMSTLYQLPQAGQKITLLTHFQVREDAQQLFGFATETEREAFRQLIKISGVGSRTALAVLSGMSVNELAQAIALQEAGRLTQVPGIGKKTAERLCLELKGKLAPDLGITGDKPQAIEASSEVLQALLALGYSEKEALLALKQIPPDTSVSDGIRMGLKYLSKA